VDNYLQSLLGTDLAARTQVIGLGEPEEGEELEFDASYRRVDLIVRVQALGAAGSKADPLESTTLELKQPSPPRK
jgi:hypothetical protein